MNCRVVIKHKDRAEEEKGRLGDELARTWGVPSIPAEQFQELSKAQRALTHDRFPMTYIYGCKSPEGRAIACYQYLDRDETMIWMECEPEEFNFTDCSRIITNGLKAVRASQRWWQPCRIEQAFFYELDHGKSLGIEVRKRDWLAVYGTRDTIGSLFTAVFIYVSAVLVKTQMPGLMTGGNPWVDQSLFAPVGLALYLVILVVVSSVSAWYRYVTRQEEISFVVKK